MIANDAELDATLGALRNAESALAALHRDIYSKNPATYEVMAEGYIDLVRSLRSEVDAYLGVSIAETKLPWAPQR